MWGKPWRNFKQEVTGSLWQHSGGDGKASEEVVQKARPERGAGGVEERGEIQEISRRLNGQISDNCQMRC